MSANPIAVAFPRRRASGLALACVVFFISGMPALIYQLAWQRSLFTIYGINVESVAVVVTGFMLGLGFGSLLGGVLSRQRFPLLLLFGAIELAIGLFGARSLELFDAVGQATIHSHPLLLKLAPLGLLLAPTLLMGATLPILTMYLVRRSGNVGRSLGLLYLLNTLGSALACFLVAFWVMRVLGLHGAVLLAAAFNVLVGACALVASFLDRAAPASVAAAATRAAAPGLPLAGGLALAAITGYISLSYEIAWFRTFSVASGGSALAFALVLGAFLVGVAGGSGVASHLCNTARSTRALLAALAATILLGCLAGYATIPLTAAAATRGTLPMILAMLGGVALAAGLIGAAFPLIAHLAVAPDERAGARVSYLYMANIAGAVAGSMLTGFYLVDALALRELVVALTLLGLALVAYLGYSARRSWRMPLVATALALPVVLAAPALFDRLYERLQLRDEYAGERYVHVLENRHGLVTIDAAKKVFGGGMYDGVVNTDLVDDVNLLIRPYSLSLWHAAPREVLMIGLSMGSWAQVIASHPHVEKLTIVEINPGYLDLIGNYPEVQSLLANPKIEIIVDDGRRWLNRNPGRTFDAIVQNTTFNFRAHVSALLSAEYLAIARERLNHGGVVMWNTTSSDRAKKTGCQVFPHGWRFNNSMITGNQAIHPDPERWASVLRQYRVDAKPVLDPSREAHARRMAKVLGEPRESCGEILARTPQLEPITDDNMGDEWRVWRFTRLFKD